MGGCFITVNCLAERGSVCSAVSPPFVYSLKRLKMNIFVKKEILSGTIGISSRNGG